MEELTKSTMGEYSWRTLMSTKGEQARIRSAGVELVSEVLGSEALARKALTIVQGIHGSIRRHVVRLPYLG